MVVLGVSGAGRRHCARDGPRRATTVLAFKALAFMALSAMFVCAAVSTSPTLQRALGIDQHHQQLVHHRGTRAVLQAASGVPPAANNTTTTSSSSESGGFKAAFWRFEQSYVGACIEVLLVVYLFLGIAYAADDYFISSLEIIAERVGMSNDVAGLLPRNQRAKPQRHNTSDRSASNSI
jgi:hypothetical protein